MMTEFKLLGELSL